MAMTLACRAGDPGSIPGRGVHLKVLRPIVVVYKLSSITKKMADIHNYKGKLKKSDEKCE